MCGVVRNMIDLMLKSNDLNSISKDIFGDDDCPWFINCTTQGNLGNVGQDSLFIIFNQAFNLEISKKKKKEKKEIEGSNFASPN